MSAKKKGSRARVGKSAASAATSQPIGAAVVGVDTKLSLSKSERAEAEQTIRAVRRFCRGALGEQHAKAVAQLLSEGRRDEASAMDAAGRTMCGADFNDVVVAGPWDGQSHPYACPRCGVPGKYTAPSFATKPAASTPTEA